MPRVRHITRPGTPSAKALSGRLSSVEFLKSSLSAKAISTLLWAQCLLVKNQLTRTSGFSPCQHVFGSMPGLPEDLLEGPHAGHPETTDIIDDKHAREVALCAAARAAYFHVDPDRRAGPARACWPGTRGEPLTRVRRARLLLSQDQEQQTRLLDRSWDRHRKGRGELLGHSRWPLSPTCSESSGSLCTHAVGE